MNKAHLFDNKKYYLIDLETHVVFTPGYDNHTEAINKAIEVNNIPTPKNRLPLHVGIVNGLPINKAGYKSTIPLCWLRD